MRRDHSFSTEVSRHRNQQNAEALRLSDCGWSLMKADVRNLRRLARIGDLKREILDHRYQTENNCMGPCQLVLRNLCAALGSVRVANNLVSSQAVFDMAGVSVRGPQTQIRGLNKSMPSRSWSSSPASPNRLTGRMNPPTSRLFRYHQIVAAIRRRSPEPYNE